MGKAVQTYWCHQYDPQYCENDLFFQTTFSPKSMWMNEQANNGLSSWLNADNWIANCIKYIPLATHPWCREEHFFKGCIESTYYFYTVYTLVPYNWRLLLGLRVLHVSSNKWNSTEMWGESLRSHTGGSVRKGHSVAGKSGQKGSMGWKDREQEAVLEPAIMSLPDLTFWAARGCSFLLWIRPSPKMVYRDLKRPIEGAMYIRKELHKLYQ